MDLASRTAALDAHDERAIAAVLIRYATGIDRRDWSLFRSCFAEDFVGDYGPFGKWRGPREITDYMRAAHADLGATLHRVSNITVDRREDGVCARSYVDAILTSAEAGGSIRRGIGWYDDRLARTAGGWQITRRTFHPVMLE